MVTFSGGIVAAGIQAALTRLMHPEIVEMKQFWTRLAVAVIGASFYTTAMVCGILGHIRKSGFILPSLIMYTESLINIIFSS